MILHVLVYKPYIIPLLLFRYNEQLLCFMGGRTTLFLIENIHKEITVIISVEMVIWPRAKKPVEHTHTHTITQSYTIPIYFIVKVNSKDRTTLANQAKPSSDIK